MKPRIPLATLGAVIGGGMLGVAARAGLVLPLGDAFWAVALATMTINIVGSGLLGVVVGWLDDRRPLLRAFVGTGVLGGFTTYSAFAVHTVGAGAGAGAIALAAASVVGGVIAAAAGLWLGRRIADVPGEIEPGEDAR